MELKESAVLRAATETLSDSIGKIAFRDGPLQIVGIPATVPGHSFENKPRLVKDSILKLKFGRSSTMTASTS